MVQRGGSNIPDNRFDKKSRLNMSDILDICNYTIWKLFLDHSSSEHDVVNILIPVSASFGNNNHQMADGVLVIEENLSAPTCLNIYCEYPASNDVFLKFLTTIRNIQVCDQLYILIAVFVF